jgi:ribosomal protein S18 acetylase RimI-like enzyme
MVNNYVASQYRHIFARVGDAVVSDADVTIVPYLALVGREGLAAELDAIFFEASGTRDFESEAHRAAFRERWLGRYLTHYPEDVLLAVGTDGRVAGYLAGCLEPPTATRRFDDIAYFQAFAALIPAFPAHLHINLAPQYRGRGAGSRLIAAFVLHAEAAGSAGVHVVTGKGMRNVGFYQRNGFTLAGETVLLGKPLVLLGRALQKR